MLGWGGDCPHTYILAWRTYVCTCMYMATFLQCPIFEPRGPGMEKTKKDESHGYLHTLYIYTDTYILTPHPCLRVRVRVRARFSPFLSNSLSHLHYSKIMREQTPLPFLTNTPGSFMLGLNPFNDER